MLGLCPPPERAALRHRSGPGVGRSGCGSVAAIRTGGAAGIPSTSPSARWGHSLLRRPQQGGTGMHGVGGLGLHWAWRSARSASLPGAIAPVGGTNQACSRLPTPALANAGPARGVRGCSAAQDRRRTHCAAMEFGRAPPPGAAAAAAASGASQGREVWGRELWHSAAVWGIVAPVLTTIIVTTPSLLAAPPRHPAGRRCRRQQERRRPASRQS